jgi:glycerol-3-phosphate dehydrogenase
MPITDAVVQILDGIVTPDEALRVLMGRPLRSEREH